MDKETRSKYAEKIASEIRYVQKETGIMLPDKTILVVKSYSELAELDNIIGIDIYVMDMPSSYEYFIAFPSSNEKYYKLQKAFIEAFIEALDIL